PPVQVGDNVRVPVPKVDRGRTDPGNLLGIVTSINEHGKFTVGTKEGTLRGSYSRSQVKKCKQNVFVSQEQVPDITLSVRSAGRRGFIFCNCSKGGCSNG
ncbi:unnamed protein product, partial [Meganyctiphanes norvegica]